MEIVYKKVNELIPYINNSRTHSEEQVNQILIQALLEMKQQILQEKIMK